MSRYGILQSMHNIVLTLNDENAYMHWINLIPDGVDETELSEIAECDDLFDDACRLFTELIQMYGNDGYFVERKLWGDTE